MLQFQSYIDTQHSNVMEERTSLDVNCIQPSHKLCQQEEYSWQGSSLWQKRDENKDFRQKTYTWKEKIVVKKWTHQQDNEMPPASRKNSLFVGERDCSLHIFFIRYISRWIENLETRAFTIYVVFCFHRKPCGIYQLRSWFYAVFYALLRRPAKIRKTKTHNFRLYLEYC